MKKNLLACVLAFTLIGCTSSTKSVEKATQVPIENWKLIEFPTPEITLSPTIVPTQEPTPEPTIKPTPMPKPTIKPKPAKLTYKYYKIKYGKASTYGPGYAGFLALPEGRGILVEVCGPAGCIIRRSNDAGPNLAMQRAGRIIDLNVNDFETVCGCNWKVVGIIKEIRVRYISE